ncbi:hypothetical protein JCM19233_3068 [Vibrio astriarenae]|nr:hypothetical protein JCM19233_3068 [Vibrio sp. C7]
MKLHSKQLLALWDLRQYGGKPRANFRVDGQFVFDVLFSVAAVASKPNRTPIVDMAQVLSEKQLVKLRACEMRSQNIMLLL